MASTMLYTLSFVALAAAQASSTTVSLLLPDANPQSSLVGSIAGSDSSATTYVIACAGTASTALPAPSAGLNGSDTGGLIPGCGFTGFQTVIQGPSTYHWTMNVTEIGAAITVDCGLSGTTQAVCTERASGPGVTANIPTSVGTDQSIGIPSVTITTLTGSDLPPFRPVVITAGLSNIKGAGASSTGSAAGGKSTASGTAAAGTSSTASGTAAAGASSTASSSGSTAKSSSGATVLDPAFAVGVVGMLAAGVAAFAL